VPGGRPQRLAGHRVPGGRPQRLVPPAGAARMAAAVERCVNCADANQDEKVMILGRTATTSSSPVDQAATTSRGTAVEADNSGTYDGGLTPGDLPRTTAG
jgi:hypothetical protein